MLTNPGKLIQKFSEFPIWGHDLDQFLENSSMPQNSNDDWMIFAEIRLAHESCPGFETKFYIQDFSDGKSQEFLLKNPGKLNQKFSEFSIWGHVGPISEKVIKLN